MADLVFYPDGFPEEPAPQPPQAGLSVEERERLREIAAHLDRMAVREHDFQSFRETQDDAAFLRSLADQKGEGS